MLDLNGESIANKEFETFKSSLDTAFNIETKPIEYQNNINGYLKEDKKKALENEAMQLATGGVDTKYSLGKPFDYKQEKPTWNTRNYNDEELYSTLSSGETVKNFDTYTRGIDNYEQKAQNQTTLEKWKNGLYKAGNTLITGVIGGTVGAIYGVAEMIKEGSFSALYDNDLQRNLDLYNEKLKFTDPNYKTKEERENSWIEGVGTANFWADEVTNGIAFTVQAIATEAIWAYATGGTSLATTEARMGLKAEKALNYVDDLVKASAKAKSVYIKPLADATANSMLTLNKAVAGGRIGRDTNMLRSLITGAGYEAGFEARAYMTEARQNFNRDWIAVHGAPPTEEEKQQFENSLKDTANGLFAYNLAIVGSSNIAQFGAIRELKLPSVFKNSEEFFNKKIFGSGVKIVDNAPKIINASRLQKIGQYTFSIGKGAIVEGAWEEGMQAVGKNTASNLLSQGYEQKFANESYDMVKAFGEGLDKTYGTEEGRKEVYTGMIIGGLTGNVLGVYQNKTLNHEFVNPNNRAKNIEDNFGKNATYSSKVAVENMLMSNRIIASKKAEENAEKNGDWLGGNIARNNTMYAQFQRAEALNYFDETVDSNLKHIELLDEQTLMKENGITLDQAQELKESMKEEYKKQALSFKRVSEFSNYFIGNKINKQEKAEIEKHLENKGYSSEEAKNISSDVLRQALSYELYTGEVAHNHSSEMLEAFQNNLQNVLGSSRIKQAFSINDVLNKATTATKTDFNNTKKDLEKTTKEFEAVEKKYRDLENIVNTKTTPEARQAVVSQLGGLQIRINELSDKKTNLEKEISILYNSAKMENPFGVDKSEEFIPTEDILNLEKDINKVLQTIEEYKKIAPQKAEVMSKLLKEYEKSIGAFKTYSKRTSQILEGNIGLRGKQNIITELFKNKTPKEATISMIKGLLDTHYSAQETLADKAKELAVQAKQEEVLDTESGVDMVAYTPTKQKINNKEYIVEQIKKYPYLFNQIGENFEEALPTENEISEYYTLLTQETPSEEDSTRLEELNTKMANWQLLEAVDGGGVTISEMILQDVQNEEDIKETEEQVLSEDDLTTITKNGEPESIDGKRPLNILQTIKNVFIQKKDKNTWFISHLTPKGFLNLIGETGEIKYYYTKKNKKGQTVIDGNVLTTTTDKINDFVKIGMVVEFGNTQIKISNGNRIEVKDTDLDSTIFRKRQTKSGYSILFDSEGKAMISDFKDVNTISDEEIYDLSEGERLLMKVDLNDSYNKSLIDQDDTVIEKNVKISLYRENGTKLGELKAQYESDEAEDSFQKIRQSAATALKESNEDLVELGSVQHSHVFLGAPNLKLDENNKEEEFEINPEKIITYGYWNGSSLTLREKLKVRTDLLKGIDKKLPIVVVKQGNFLIAYPVSLIKIPSQKGDIITNTGLSEAQIVLGFNKALKEAGKKNSGLYYLSPENQNFYNEDGTLTDTFNKALQKVNDIPITNQNWLDKNHKKEQLKGEATINIDLEHRALLSPKIAISTDTFQEYKLDVMTEEQATSLVNDFISKKISSPIKKIKQLSGNLLYKKGIEYFIIENNPFGEGLITFFTDSIGYSKEHKEWISSPNQETLDNLLKKKSTRVKIQSEEQFPITKSEEIELLEKEIENSPQLKRKLGEITELNKNKKEIADKNKKC